MIFRRRKKRKPLETMERIAVQAVIATGVAMEGPPMSNYASPAAEGQ